MFLFYYREGYCKPLFSFIEADSFESALEEWNSLYPDGELILIYREDL